MPSPSAAQSSPVSTAKTPGICSAAALSIDADPRMGVRREHEDRVRLARQIDVRDIAPRPVRNRASSLRVTGCPMPNRMPSPSASG